MLAHGWRIAEPTDEDLGDELVAKIEKLGRDAVVAAWRKQPWMGWSASAMSLSAERAAAGMAKGALLGWRPGDWGLVVLDFDWPKAKRTPEQRDQFEQALSDFIAMTKPGARYSSLSGWGAHLLFKEPPSGVEVKQGTWICPWDKRFQGDVRHRAGYCVIPTHEAKAKPIARALKAESALPDWLLGARAVTKPKLRAASPPVIDDPDSELARWLDGLQKLGIQPFEQSGDWKSPCPRGAACLGGDAGTDRFHICIKGGRILAHCRKGCSFDDLRAAVLGPGIAEAKAAKDAEGNALAHRLLWKVLMKKRDGSTGAEKKRLVEKTRVAKKSYGTARKKKETTAKAVRKTKKKSGGGDREGPSHIVLGEGVLDEFAELVYDPAHYYKWLAWVENEGWAAAERAVSQGAWNQLRPYPEGHQRQNHASGAIKYVQSKASCSPEHAPSWDATPWVIGAPNCKTINLKTGDVRASVPSDYAVNRIASGAAEGNGDRFHEYVVEWCSGDEQDAEFLRTFCGVCLSGTMPWHRRFIVHVGEGSEGKSTFWRAIQDAMGPYAITIEPMVFQGKEDDHSTILARIHGKRLVVATEAPSGGAPALKSERIKQFTGGGGDRVRAHFMRRDSFEFDPMCGIVMLGNRAPRIKAVGRAMKDRALMVRWTRAYGRHERREDFNQMIRETMLDEVVAWMLTGIKAFAANGEKLVVSPGIAATTAEWLAGEATAEAFAAARLAPGTASNYVIVSELRSEYEDYCAGLGKYPQSPAEMNAGILSVHPHAKRGTKDKDMKNGGVRRASWRMLRWKHDDEIDEYMPTEEPLPPEPEDEGLPF